MDKPYDPDYKKRWEISRKRDCHWEAGFDKEFSLCWSKFIDEKTGIPWVTKYYSVKPIEKNIALYSHSDKALILNFDIFGFYGLGYEQKLTIYNTHMKDPRMAAGLFIPKSNNQLFNHNISFYDKGSGIGSKEGPPTIIYNYKVLYKENEDILDRSFAELYYATEFFFRLFKFSKINRSI